MKLMISHFYEFLMNSVTAFVYFSGVDVFRILRIKALIIASSSESPYNFFVANNDARFSRRKLQSGIYNSALASLACASNKSESG